MVDELVPVDDVDGVPLLPEVAGLLLGEDGQVGGILLFMGVLLVFLVFLRGDVVFSSSSSLFFSLLWGGVVVVWAWAWWGVCLAGVWGGGGVVVCITVSRWTWAWPWWYWGLSWGAGPLLVSGDGDGSCCGWCIGCMGESR